MRWVLVKALLAAGILAASVFGQPTPLLDQLGSAQELVNAGHLEQADKAVRKYLQTNPNSADARFLLGKILFREKKATDSLAEFTEGAKYRTPTSVELEVVAMDYVLLNSFTDADKWFTRALEGNPNNALGWYYLGRTKYNENRFEEAVQAFQKCLELDVRNVKAEDNLGLSYEGLGKYEKARAAYGNAITWQANVETKSAEPFFDLGGLYLAEDRPGEALPPLEQALRLAPDEAKMHQRLGKCYLALSKLDQAQSELEIAVRTNPQDASLHYLLQQVYRKQGLTEKANNELARYRELQNGPSVQHP